MCRRKQMFGVALLGFGVGLLVASLFDSGFFCGCLGLMIMVAGVVCWQKK